jgi:multiple sugar transport system ATP-binding protein
VEENGILFAQGEKFKLAIPASLRKRFLGAKGRRAVLGIRPEHLYEKGIKSPFHGGEILRVEIEVVEPVGSEVILIASCGSVNITACVDPQTEAKPGTSMELLVDMNRMHLFDKDTGEAY